MRFNWKKGILVHASPLFGALLFRLPRRFFWRRRGLLVRIRGDIGRRRCWRLFLYLLCGWVWGIAWRYRATAGCALVLKGYHNDREGEIKNYDDLWSMELVVEFNSYQLWNGWQGSIPINWLKFRNNKWQFEAGTGNNIFLSRLTEGLSLVRFLLANFLPFMSFLEAFQIRRRFDTNKALQYRVAWPSTSTGLNRVLQKCNGPFVHYCTLIPSSWSVPFGVSRRHLIRCPSCFDPSSLWWQPQYHPACEAFE